MHHVNDRRTAFTRILAVCILACALVAAAAGCPRLGTGATNRAGSPSQAALPPGARRVETFDGKLVVVRSIDDPENPYREEYKEWDRWFWDHLLEKAPEQKLYRDMTEEEKALKEAHRQLGMGWTGVMHRVDERGFFIPLERSMREREEAISAGKLDERDNSGQWVMAEGEIDPEMHQASWDAGFAVSAEYYPPIPAWLAANPPYEALLLPNGDVVTWGLLGITDRDYNYGPNINSLYARYDKDGNLIAKVEDKGWFMLYYDPEGTGRPLPDGEYEDREDGYFMYRDPYSGGLLSVWNWDGTPMPPVEPPWRDPHPFRLLRANMLQDMYSAVHGAEPEEQPAGTEPAGK
jgi:hypothetical protein